MVTAAARSSIAAALVFAAGVLLVAGNAPLWGVAIGLAGVAWRIFTLGRAQPPKRRIGMRFLLGAVTALLVAAVALSFRTLNGLAAGTALLVVMGALKLVESRARRDDAIVIGVALFLLLAAALADQSLWRVPLYLLAAWGACTAIALVAHGDSLLTTRAALRLSARALAMAIPLALACFAFFPRVAGHFWALQRDASGGHGTVRRDVAGQHRQDRQRIRSGVPREFRRHAAAAAPRCTGAARCSTASTDSPGGASAGACTCPSRWSGSVRPTVTT